MNPNEQTRSFRSEDKQLETVTLGQEPSSEFTGAFTPNQADRTDDFPVLPGYRIIAEIAKGGMGRVYAGHDLSLDREVAIKTLLPSANAERFVIESKITAMLPHPGIPPVYALGQLDDGTPYLAMKLIRGRTLTELLKIRPSVNADLPRFLQIFEQIAQAVGFAHSRGIIHRDLKPLNVMVGEFGEVQVMDWGLAKNLKAAVNQHDSLDPEQCFTGVGQTVAGAVMGTPSYMSPEQARGEVVDARADVFSLGAILAAILTGQPAFVGTTLRETIERAANADLANVLERLDQANLDTELIKLTRKCLSANAVERFANAREVAEAMATYQACVAARLQQAETERAQAQVRDIEQRKRQRILLMATGALLAIFTLAVTVSSWFAWQSFKDAQRADNEASIARTAEAESRQLAIAESAANLLAQIETKRANENLRQSRWSGYASKLLLAQAAFNDNSVPLAYRYLDESDWELRGWEHAHLRWKFDSSRQTLRGHTREVLSVSVSPDARRVVTGSVDQSAKVWDAETGNEILTLKGHTHVVNSVTFSPDAKRIVTGSWDTTAKVWDAETGTLILTLKGHAKIITSVAYSPDGNHIVTGSHDNTAKVWNAQKGTEILSFMKHTNPVNCVAFSPDGQRIASGSHDTTVKIWDVVTGAEVRTIKGHPQPVIGVVYSPDGRRIVTCCKDHLAKMWDVETGNEILTLAGHASQLQAVAYSPDGRRILTASNDSLVKVWDSEKGSEIRTLKGHANTVSGLAYSPDGQRILTASHDKTAKVWDANKGKDISALKGHRGVVNSVTYSPDGNTILTCGYDNTAKVWNAQNFNLQLTLTGHHAFVSSVSYSPNGKRIVTGSWDNTAKIWDANSGNEIFTLRGHSKLLSSVVYSPDGQWIITGSWDKTVKVWNAETFTESRTIKANLSEVNCIALSPNSKRILIGTADNIVTMWDIETGTQTLAFKGHHAGIYGVVFSRDGKRIATGSRDKTVIVWDAQNGTRELMLVGHTEPVTSIAFSPDGNRILTGSTDNSVKIWDAEKGNELVTLREHQVVVECVAFSPDGKRILSGSADATVKVWDTDNSPQPYSLRGHSQRVHRVAFTPDCTRVFAWDNVGHVLAWNMTTGQQTTTDHPPDFQGLDKVTSSNGRFSAYFDRDVVLVMDLSQQATATNSWQFPKLNERKQYHMLHANLAEQEKNWFAVAFHVQRLLVDDPANAILKKRYGDAFSLIKSVPAKP